MFMTWALIDCHSSPFDNRRICSQSCRVNAGLALANGLLKARNRDEVNKGGSMTSNC